MNMKALSLDAARKLLKGEEAKDIMAENDRWPGDQNLLKLAKAVDECKRFVMFGSKRFKISIVHWHDEKMVRLNPTIGFAPMGYFTFKQLEDVKRSVPELT